MFFKTLNQNYYLIKIRICFKVAKQVLENQNCVSLANSEFISDLCFSDK